MRLDRILSQSSQGMQKGVGILHHKTGIQECNVNLGVGTDISQWIWFTRGLHITSITDLGPLPKEWIGSIEDRDVVETATSTADTIREEVEIDHTLEIIDQENDPLSTVDYLQVTADTGTEGRSL